jgi:Flp pilus assembly pilin Flp
MHFPVAHLTSLFRGRAARRAGRRGQTLVEYALVLAVLTVVMVACMKLLGDRIVVVFSDITGILDTAQSSH